MIYIYVYINDVMYYILRLSQVYKYNLKDLLFKLINYNTKEKDI